jgi:hypothetical protein
VTWVSEREHNSAREHIANMSDQRLAVELQKMAKAIGHHQNKWYRSELLNEAARRLSDRNRSVQA